MYRVSRLHGVVWVSVNRIQGKSQQIFERRRRWGGSAGIYVISAPVPAPVIICATGAFDFTVTGSTFERGVSPV